MPEWIKGLIGISLFLVGLVAFGQAFHSHMLLFFIFWLLLPLIVLGARRRDLLSLLTRKGIILFQAIAMGIVILISIFLFANFDNLRDNFGKQYIEGYSVHYDEDTDDVGRPIRGAGVDTQHFSGQVLIRLSALIFIALCFGIPALMWKATQLTVSEWEDIKLIENKETINTCTELYNKAKRTRPGKSERDYLKIVLLTKPPFDYQVDGIINDILDAYHNITELAEMISRYGDDSGLWKNRKITLRAGILEKRNKDFIAEFWGSMR